MLSELEKDGDIGIGRRITISINVFKAKFLWQTSIVVRCGKSEADEKILYRKHRYVFGLIHLTCKNCPHFK